MNKSNFPGFIRNVNEKSYMEDVWFQNQHDLFIKKENALILSNLINLIGYINPTCNIDTIYDFLPFVELIYGDVNEYWFKPNPTDRWLLFSTEIITKIDYENFRATFEYSLIQKLDINALTRLSKGQSF